MENEEKNIVMENEKSWKKSHGEVMEFVEVATLDFWLWQFIGGI